MEPRTGEIDKTLWIPLEDMHDGWEQAGQVGQEIYGSGLPFGLVPRHYHRVDDGGFMIYVEYPTLNFKSEEGQVTFTIFGDRRLDCRMRFIPTGRKPLPDLEVAVELEGNKQKLKGQETKEGHLEYEVYGDHSVTVSWRQDGPVSRNGKEKGK